MTLNISFISDYVIVYLFMIGYYAADYTCQDWSNPHTLTFHVKERVNQWFTVMRTCYVHPLERLNDMYNLKLKWKRKILSQMPIFKMATE